VIELAKRVLRKRFPDLLNALHGYALHRDLHARKLVQTPHGFRFRGHQLMEAGTFEPDEVALIQRFAKPGTVFVDVGANFGYYICLARQQEAHVVAVEPLRENLDILYGNLESNGWGDVEIFPMALGAEPGTAVLYGGGTAASFGPRWAGQSEAFKRTVAVTTMDALLAARFPGREMFIKIDVEGFEHVVLEGASQTLARTPAPRWLIEVCLTEHHPQQCNPHFEHVFRVFREHGYTAHTVEAQPRVVTADDVSRWVANRRRDFGHINYFFSKS
jgi:FkbM family methyltransferase